MNKDPITEDSIFHERSQSHDQKSLITELERIVLNQNK